jgi:hypothetical protein
VQCWSCCAHGLSVTIARRTFAPKIGRVDLPRRHGGHREGFGSPAG